MANTEDKESVFKSVPFPFDAIPLFMQLLLFKLLKPQSLVKGFKEYVSAEIGPEYAISPQTSMNSLFNAADKTTPIIFVLSPGADPNDQIINYAKRNNFEKRLIIKSLGQGQEKVALRLI